MRLDELISNASQVIFTIFVIYSVSKYVLPENFNEFRAVSLSFFKNTFGELHPFYTEFAKNVQDVTPYSTQEGLGILKAAKEEIEGSWIFAIKGYISAEIFSDFFL